MEPSNTIQGILKIKSKQRPITAAKQRNPYQIKNETRNGWMQISEYKIKSYENLKGVRHGSTQTQRSDSLGPKIKIGKDSVRTGSKSSDRLSRMIKT